MKRGVLTGLLLGASSMLALEACCPKLARHYIDDGMYVPVPEHGALLDDFDQVELVIDGEDAELTLADSEGSVHVLRFRAVEGDDG